MKEVFRCDYCNYIGTKEEVEEYEKVCLNNPDVKCCYNCQYAYENPYIVSVGLCINHTQNINQMYYTLESLYQKKIFANIMREARLTR